MSLRRNRYLHRCLNYIQSVSICIDKHTSLSRRWGWGWAVSAAGGCGGVLTSGGHVCCVRGLRVTQTSGSKCDDLSLRHTSAHGSSLKKPSAGSSSCSCKHEIPLLVTSQRVDYMRSELMRASGLLRVFPSVLNIRSADVLRFHICKIEGRFSLHESSISLNLRKPY